MPPPRRHARDPRRAPGAGRASRRATGSVACWCCARCSARPPTQFSAATKTFCTEFEQRVAAFCARDRSAPQAMLAEPGLSARVGRNLCYATAYTIMGGTSQILRNILGERVLGLPAELAHVDPAASVGAARARPRATSTPTSMATSRWPAVDDHRVEPDARRSRGPPRPARRSAAAAPRSAARGASGRGSGARRDAADQPRGLQRRRAGAPGTSASWSRAALAPPGPQGDHRPHLGVVVDRDRDVDARLDHRLHERRRAARRRSAPPCAPTRRRSAASSARSRARPAATRLGHRVTTGGLERDGVALDRGGGLGLGRASAPVRSARPRRPTAPSTVATSSSSSVGGTAAERAG